MDRIKTFAPAAAILMALCCFSALVPAEDSDAAALNDGDSWGLSLEFSDVDDLMKKVREKPGYESAPKDRLMLTELIKIRLGSLGVWVRSLDFDGSGDIELAMEAASKPGDQSLSVDGAVRFDGYVRAVMDVPLSDLDVNDGLGEILYNMGVDLSYLNDRVTESGSLTGTVDIDMKIRTDAVLRSVLGMNAAWHIISLDGELRSATAAKGYAAFGAREIESDSIVSETTVKEVLDSRFSEIMTASLAFQGVGVQFLPDFPDQTSWSNRTRVVGTVEGSTGYLLPLMADIEKRAPQGPFRLDLDREINYHGSSARNGDTYDVAFGIDFPSIKLPVLTGEAFAGILQDMVPGLNLSRLLSIMKLADPTMNYDRLFNILLGMFPNIDVRFPIDPGEILMDNIPDLKYRYPFERTDIPSFLFVGDSFKIPSSGIPPIVKKIEAEAERLEGILTDVKYPVTFMDGDKVIAVVMAGYGGEPEFPDYQSSSGTATGWKDADGRHWISGFTKLSGATTLYPCYTKAVGSAPTADDIGSADIVLWKGAPADGSLDLSVLDGNPWKEVVAEVGDGHSWRVESSESTYAGKSLLLGITESPVPDGFSGRRAIDLFLAQDGAGAGNAWVTYALPAPLSQERSVDLYGDGKLIGTFPVEDGSITWKYSGESAVTVAGCELPPAPEKKEEDRTLLYIMIAIAAVALCAIAVSMVRRKKASE